jgi:hypothetical protein
MTVKTRLRDWHRLKKKSPMPEMRHNVSDQRSRLTERGGNAGGMAWIHTIYHGL